MKTLFILIICRHKLSLLGTSYNQPQFSSTTQWNSKAITFANWTTVGLEPRNVFIDRNNTIYVATYVQNSIPIWRQGASLPTWTITDSTQPQSVFATDDGYIYVGNGPNKNRVQQHRWNTTATKVVLDVNELCRSLFIDRNDTIYCSATYKHQVIKKSINTAATLVERAAGTGHIGMNPWRLDEPRGIAVANNFSLYVADYKNNRVQMFRSGSLFGTTVVGNGATGTISLNAPIDIAIDNDGYLFIVDAGNNRIVGSGSNGYRCIIGCSGQSGSASNQLNHPRALSFDTYGNIYVADGVNGRIQKFNIINSLPGEIELIIYISHDVVANDFFILTLLVSMESISYNQPNFCPTASWKPNAITFANVSIVNNTMFDFFVDTNNTMYISEESTSIIRIWLQGNITPTKMTNTSFTNRSSIFVTANGNVYVANYHNAPTFRVQKFTSSYTNVSVMYTNGPCFGLFVDIYGSIYCSISDQHQVVRRLFNDTVNVTSVVAGLDNGTNGSAPHMLNQPRSIFVTDELDLYVADCNNNRVQLFKADQRNATTIVGNDTIDLNCPTGITLDGGGYVYITDYYNHRIIGSGPSGFRCIAGCDRNNGSASHQLSYPRGLRFDSYGNIFVADGGNGRIQKFLLDTTGCGKKSDMIDQCFTRSLSLSQVSLTIYRNFVHRRDGKLMVSPYPICHRMVSGLGVYLLITKIIYMLMRDQTLVS